MAIFLLDHDVHPQLGVILQDLGHHSARAYELGLATAEDAEILLAASRAGRILVTHNRGHFVAIHHAWLLWPIAWRLPWHPEHFGILVLPQTRRADRDQRAKDIDGLVSVRQALINELHVWNGAAWAQHP